MINKKILKVMLITFVILLVLVSLTYYNIISNNKILPEVKFDEKINTNITNDILKSIAKNDKYELLFNEKTTEVAIKSIDTNEIWYSNPLNRNDLDVAGTEKDRMFSQLMVKVTNEKNVSTLLSSYKDSVTQGIYKTQKINNGIKVTYSFGTNMSIKESMPEAIKKKSMEDKILKKLQLNERIEVKNAYRYNSEKEAYFIATDVESKLINAKELLNKGGYVEEDKFIDDEEKVDTKLKIQISIVYTLDKNGLNVKIPTNEILVQNNYQIESIELLEYFGAVNKTEKGSMCIADGYGNEIMFSEDKYISGQYSGFTSQYDEILALAQENKFTQNYVSFPVFGILKKNSGLMVFLKDGIGIAQNVVTTPTNNNPFYRSGFYFYPNKSETVTMGTNSKTSFSKFAPIKYSTDIIVCFSPVNQENIDFIDITNEYRKQNHEYFVNRIDKQDKYNLFLEFIGSINKQKKFMGFEYDKEIVMTSFKKAIDIVDNLNVNQIRDINLIYSGWQSMGLVNSNAINDPKMSLKISSKVNYKNFNKYLEDKNISFYPAVTMVNVNTKPRFLWGGAKSFFATDLAGRIFINPPLNLALLKSQKTKQIHYLLNPNKFENVAENIINIKDKYNFSNITLYDTNSTIYASGDTIKNYVNKQESINKLKLSLNKIKNAYNSSILSGSYVEFISNVDNLINLDINTSNNPIFTNEIPFTAAMLHGYKNFSYREINNSVNFQYEILKTAQSGSSLYLKWIGDNLEEIKTSEYSNLYYCDYRYQKEKIQQAYLKLKNALLGTNNKLITDYSKIQDDVFKTSFENGTEIVVNYSNQDISVYGKIIKAMDFEKVK